MLAVLAQRWHVEAELKEVKPFPGLTLQPSRPIRAVLRPAGTG